MKPASFPDAICDELSLTFSSSGLLGTGTKDNVEEKSSKKQSVGECIFDNGTVY